MSGGYVFVNRVPYNLSLTSYYQIGTYVHFTGADVLASLNRYTLTDTSNSSINTVIPIVPNGYGRFYIDMNGYSTSTTYRLSVRYDYKGIIRTSSLDFTYTSPVTTTQMGTTYTNANIEYPGSLAQNTTFTANPTFNYPVGSIINTVTSILDSDNYIVRINLNAGTDYKTNTSWNNIQTKMMFTNVSDGVSERGGIILYSDLDLSNNVINNFNGITTVTNTLYTVKNFYFDYNVGQNHFLYEKSGSKQAKVVVAVRHVDKTWDQEVVAFNFTINSNTLSNIKLENDKLYFNSTQVPDRYYLNSTTNEVTGINVSNNTYSYPISNLSNSSTYTFYVAKKYYSLQYFRFTLNRAESIVLNLSPININNNTISWTISGSGITYKLIFESTEDDITNSVINYSYSMALKNSGTYTLSATLSNVTESKSFTYTKPTFVLSVPTQAGKTISWTVPDADNATFTLTPSGGQGTNITTTVIKETPNFTYNMGTLSYATYTLDVSMTGYTSASKSFSYNPPFFSLSIVSAVGITITWTAANTTGVTYTLTDPATVQYDITNLVTGSGPFSFLMTTYTSTNIIPGTGGPFISTLIVGTYTLTISKIGQVSEDIYFDYFPPSLEAPVVSGSVMTWRDLVSPGFTYRLVYPNNASIDITSSIQYTTPLSYTLGRKPSGQYTLLLSYPNYPDVSQNIAYTTPLVIDSIVQKNNILTIAGYGFTQTTSFVLDGKTYVPSSSNNIATTVNYDNYELNNVDMVKSFVVGYGDGTFPTSSGTVKFTGVFKPTTTGNWTFLIKADDYCNVTIGTPS